MNLCGYWTSDYKEIKILDKKPSPIEQMFKPNIKITIDNADTLDMTPEQFKEMQQRSARSSNELKQDHPDIRDQQMDI
jgi:hypothetical protein